MSAVRLHAEPAATVPDAPNPSLADGQAVAGAAVRRRDQPFAQVLAEVAAQAAGGAVTLAPHRQHGKPTVAGTRLPVSVVLTYVAAGYSLEQVAEAFPYVTAAQVRAALEYAAEVLDQDVGA
jgi:uncharacterized protein (DUF433 family)